MCISPYCMLFTLFIAAVFFLGITLSTPVLYDKYLSGDGIGAIYYILTNAAIQCGAGNSQNYQGINLEGSMQPRDTLLGDFDAWLVRRDEVKLYSRQLGPFSDGYTLTNDEHFAVLERWEAYYLWEGSVVSGFCCVQNQNGTKRTASLHVFTSDEDVMHFKSSGKAENFVFSETLTIPPDAERCFENWGPGRPLTVRKNAYYFFILHVAADNMNFTSEITYNQTYVNTRDYRHQKHFNYNSHTYFPYPTGFQQPTDYIAICRAPDSLTMFNTSRPEAASLHIRSWQSPYSWRAALPVIATFCSLCFVGAFFAGCIVLCKLLKPTQSCTLRKQCRGYTSLN